MAAYAHIQHMTPPTTRGRCWGGSIACSDCSDHIYQYAKFGACFQKCTNIVLSQWTISSFSIRSCSLVSPWITVDYSPLLYVSRCSHRLLWKVFTMDRSTSWARCRLFSPSSFLPTTLNPLCHLTFSSMLICCTLYYQWFCVWHLHYHWFQIFPECIFLSPWQHTCGS